MRAINNSNKGLKPQLFQALIQNLDKVAEYKKT